MTLGQFPLLNSRLTTLFEQFFLLLVILLNDLSENGRLIALSPNIFCVLRTVLFVWKWEKKTFVSLKFIHF